MAQRSLWHRGLTGVLLFIPTILAAQQTTAERTGFQETSSYSDVLDFLRALQHETTDIRVATLARSVEGRDIPWVLAARPMVDGPIAAHATGKPIVYLQGNIHAGEVEGKEAAQMLLRDMTVGPLRSLLDSVILLVVPIYNVDGNERFGPVEEHRPGQNGPVRVGLRSNGQGIGLNRDYIKMEAPETRGAAWLINRWDPDIFIDMHTTNGSYHGYQLTYAPGLNPNDNVANAYVRDEFLPLIRQRVRERHGQEIFWYGNFRNQNPDSLDQGWYTYDARPRFGTNWFGMRGRMAILSDRVGGRKVGTDSDYPGPGGLRATTVRGGAVAIGAAGYHGRHRRDHRARRRRRRPVCQAQANGPVSHHRHAGVLSIRPGAS